jgi:multiple sugar transport system ATP-binding protein
MSRLVLDHLTKVYPDGFEAVTDLSLSIEDGEFLVLVGPSGCGKSTALRMIAGLEEITTGELRIGDQVVNEVQPKDRDVAMVFQNYALYPQMTVYDNIGFALKMARVPKQDRDQRIRQAAKVLELEDNLEGKPGQLSGGQRQRVAMGRAIVRQPSVFLMDEPLSNLDAKLRVQMRAEISRLQHDLGVTTLYVTHDQVEAMTMGDRVAVIKDGVLQQVDSPQNLYDRPNNVFVAAFIGSPSMNLFEGVLSISDDAGSVALGSQSLEVPSGVFIDRPRLRRYDGRPVIFGIRPEHLTDAEFGADHPAGQRVRSKALLVEEFGADVFVHFSLDAAPVDTGDPDALDDLNADETIAVGRFAPGTRAREDETIEVAVNCAHLSFFDLATRQAIQD